MRMVTLAESFGSGERAIMWAPRWASDWRIVRPSGGCKSALDGVLSSQATEQCEMQLYSPLSTPF